MPQSRMRGLGGVGLILGLWACAEARPSYLAAPDPPAGGSAVLFALAKGSVLEAFAWDGDEPGPRLDLSWISES